MEDFFISSWNFAIRGIEIAAKVGNNSSDRMVIARSNVVDSNVVETLFENRGVETKRAKRKAGRIRRGTTKEIKTDDVVTYWNGSNVYHG